MKTSTVLGSAAAWLFALLSLWPAGPVAASPKIWDGSSSGYWGTAANWSNNVAPVNGDDLVFPSTATRFTVTNNIADLRVNSITFADPFNTYLVRGNPITLTNGISASGSPTTVALDITLGAAQTFECIINLTLSSNIALGSHTLTLAGDGMIRLHGILSGTGGLIKNDTGTLELAGDDGNTFTGDAYVQAGTLLLAKTSGDAVPGTLHVGTIGGASHSAVARNTEPTQVGSLVINHSGLYDLNGHNEAVWSLTLTDGGDVQTGTGTLTLSTGSAVTVNAPNWFGAVATISGKLNVGSGSHTFNVTSELQIDAVISGSADIIKEGSGLMGLTAANTFSGDVTINAGTVRMAHASALGTTAGSTIVKTGAELALQGALTVGAEDLDFRSTGPGTAPTLSTSGGNSSWAGDISLTADAIFDVATRLDLSGVISGAGGFAKEGAGQLWLGGGDSANTFAGDAQVNEGTLSLDKFAAVKAVPGRLRVGTLSGTTGSVVAENLRSEQVGGSVEVLYSGLYDLNGFNETLSDLSFVNGGEVQTGGGILTLSENSTISVSGGPSVSGRLSVGSGTCTIQGSGYLLLHANVSGSASIVKNDAVSLFLYGANTFAGTLTANGSGYLCPLHPLAFGSTNAGTVLNGSTYLALTDSINITNEALTMNSSSSLALDVFGPSTNVWAGSVTLDADTDVLVNVYSVLEVRGMIGGISNLTKNGPGTLVFSGSTANTLSGAVTVNAGTLELNKTTLNSAIPASVSSLNIGDGVGDDEADVVRLLADHQINSAVPITILDPGLLDLDGHDDTIGPLTLNGGVVDSGLGTAALSGNVAVLSEGGRIDGQALLNAPRTFWVSNDAMLLVRASVGGSGGIAKSGAGYLGLFGSNDYSGLTLLQEGELVLYHAGGLGTTNAGTVVSNGASLVFAFLDPGRGVTNEALTLNGVGVRTNFGALDDRSYIGVTSYWAGPITLNASSTIGPARFSMMKITGLINGAGSLTKVGEGQLYFEGNEANTYAGTTRVEEGTLILGKTGGGAIPGALSIAGTVRMAVDLQTSALTDVDIEDGGLLDINGCMAYINRLTGRGRVDVGTAGKWLVAGSGGGSSAFDGIISGTGDFYKYGSGTLTLTGTNTLTGKTRIWAGTLLVNGYQPQSPVEFWINPSGSLGGTGVVGPISVTGHLRPGTSPGCLTTSNLTFASSGNFHVELNGTTPCTGYDQLIAGGTHDLGGATLQVTTAFPPSDPVSLGDQFVIINNDGAEAVTGTFNGLPDGTEFNVGAYRFRINYGNDVVLTVVGLPLSGAAAMVSTGNGNHVIDPNECNFLDLVLTNATGTAMNNVAAVLSTTHQQAQVTQPYSVYPDIPNGARRTNTTPFQVSTLANFPCGDDFPLQLAVATSTHGAFVLPLRLESGGPASSFSRYDNSTPTVIPDPGSVDSAVTVSGFSGPLMKVEVSFHITHNAIGNLTASLIGPDGTTVELTSNNGLSYTNYGASCADANRTWFDDAAAEPITVDAAPYVGRFRPESPLSAFIGKRDAEVNGTWTLRVADGFPGVAGTLRCWSLLLHPVACTDGGGFCDLCLPPISGVIEASDPQQLNRWQRDDVVGSCGAPKAWTGLGAAGNFHYDTHTFTNLTAADACVTVNLQSDSDVMAAMYLDSFNPNDIRQNYHGDAGCSTAENGGRTTFSATVPAGARFLVTVNEVTPNAGTLPYTLTLSGLPCPLPTLAAEAVPTDKVRVHWPTWAGGYKLEASTNVAPTAWTVVTNEPLVGGGRYHVTNSTLAPTNRFYRLRQVSPGP